MTTKIHRHEISSDWVDTSLVRTDGKIEFRQKPRFGNKHAIFDIASDWGDAHNDEFNALDFPIGTNNHLAKYLEEKTTLPFTIAKIGLVAGELFLGMYLLKRLEEWK